MSDQKKCDICFSSSKRRLIKCTFCVFHFHQMCIKKYIETVDPNKIENCPMCSNPNFCKTNLTKFINKRIKKENEIFMAKNKNLDFKFMRIKIETEAMILYRMDKKMPIFKLVVRLKKIKFMLELIKNIH